MELGLAAADGVAIEATGKPCRPIGAGITHGWIADIVPGGDRLSGLPVLGDSTLIVSTGLFHLDSHWNQAPRAPPPFHHLA